MRGPEESSSSEGGRDLREDIVGIQLSRNCMKRAERGQMSEHLVNIDADLRSRALA